MSGRAEAFRALEHGFTMTFPAGRFERFAASAAESLLGQTVAVDAKDFGIDRAVEMTVRRAEVVDDGRGISLTLRPDY